MIAPGEARALEPGYVRAEHLLLGLFHVLVAVTYEHGVAMSVLGSLGAEHERIRRGALDRLSQQRGESSERRH